MAAILALMTSCGSGDGSYDASGAFEATEVIVSAETSGRILSFSPDEGSLITAGQNLGCIDSIQIYLKKRQLEASLDGLESRRPDIPVQTAALARQIATAKSERQRVENLLDANAANQKQLDDLNAQIEVLQKQLAATRTGLTSQDEGLKRDADALKLQIKQIEDQLSRCRLVAPVSGTILEKYSRKGEMAMPGKALYKVADTGIMYLRAYVTADQLTRMKIGQELTVSADFGEKDARDYPGTITWIASRAEFTPKTIQTRDERAHLVYAVKVKVVNDGYLKIGMYGSLKLK